MDPETAKGDFDIMVDGGFTANFPIFVFDHYDTLQGNPVRTPNRATLGMRIDSDEQIIYDQQNKGLAPMEIESLRDYMVAFYNYVLENLNRPLLTAEDWQRTISISSGGIGPKVRELSDTQKEQLYNNGRKAVSKFFE